MACALLCMPSPQLNVIISTTHRHHTLQVPTSCIASRATSAFHTARLDGQAPPPPPLHATPHFIASTTSPATPPTAIPSTALTPLITSPPSTPPPSPQACLTAPTAAGTPLPSPPPPICTTTNCPSCVMRAPLNHRCPCFRPPPSPATCHRTCGCCRR